MFSINYHFLKYNCILFFVILFIFEFIYLAFFTKLNYSSLNIPSSALVLSRTDNKFIFKHIQPFYHRVSCQKLIESDFNELKHAISILFDLHPVPLIADSQYNVSYEQCRIYRVERFNESFHLRDTSTNRQFSLAFGILMHKSVEQFERLLRVIYRPQNFYCVHVDLNASSSVFEGVKSIVNCFDNVFLSTKREEVLYGTFSRLQADLNCMSDLLKYPSWKYLLNMANTELPLKTNSELVKILSIYRGYNDVEGRWKTRNHQRTNYVWKLTQQTNTSFISILRRTNERKKPPPGNIEIIKGSAYGRR